jgi:TRAP-type mannitol/chloroaromatic compound transport system permease small subunit
VRVKFIDRIDRLNTLVGRTAAWSVLLMALIGALNALASYLEPLAGRRLASVALDELQWYLFSALFLLAAPWALRENAHVRVDVTYGRLGPRGKAWTDLLGGALLLLPFCIYALVVSFPAAADSLRTGEVSPDPGGLPRWPIKAVLPVAFVLLALQGLANTMRAARELRRGMAS